MYIIAIGWTFVTLLMALTETSFVAGVLTFFFYGLAPLALFVWLFGTPQRLRNKQRSLPPAPRPTVDFAQPAGSGGTEQCSAKPHPRPQEGSDASSAAKRPPDR
jgi:hypothetical protein